MRTKGTVLIALGLLLIAGSAGLAGFNLWQSTQAGETAAQDLALLLDTEDTPTGPREEILIQSVPKVESLPVPEMPVTEINGREYVGTVELPTIDRTLPVLNGWDSELLQIAPCRYAGSAYTGDLILMAHNYDSHFGRLNKLHIGDPVTFRDVAGNSFSYEVAVLETLKPEDTRQMEEGDWDLTLFTCTVGGKTRVTIRCTLLSVEINMEQEKGIR